MGLLRKKGGVSSLVLGDVDAATAEAGDVDVERGGRSLGATAPAAEEVGVSVLERGEMFQGGLVYPIVADDTETGVQGRHMGAQLDRAAQHRLDGTVLVPYPYSGARDGRGKEPAPRGGFSQVARAVILTTGDGAGLGTIEAGKAPIGDFSQSLLDRD